MDFSDLVNKEVKGREKNKTTIEEEFEKSPIYSAIKAMPDDVRQSAIDILPDEQVQAIQDSSTYALRSVIEDLGVPEAFSPVRIVCISSKGETVINRDLTSNDNRDMRDKLERLANEIARNGLMPMSFTMASLAKAYTNIEKKGRAREIAIIQTDTIDGRQAVDILEVTSKNTVKEAKSVKVNDTDGDKSISKLWEFFFASYIIESRRIKNV